MKSLKIFTYDPLSHTAYDHGNVSPFVINNKDGTVVIRLQNVSFDKYVYIESVKFNIETTGSFDTYYAITYDDNVPSAITNVLFDSTSILAFPISIKKIIGPSEFINIWLKSITHTVYDTPWNTWVSNLTVNYHTSPLRLKNSALFLFNGQPESITDTDVTGVFTVHMNDGLLIGGGARVINGAVYIDQSTMNSIDPAPNSAFTFSFYTTEHILERTIAKATVKDLMDNTHSIKYYIDTDHKMHIVVDDGNGTTLEYQSFSKFNENNRVHVVTCYYIDGSPWRHPPVVMLDENTLHFNVVSSISLSDSDLALKDSDYVIDSINIGADENTNSSNTLMGMIDTLLIYGSSDHSPIDIIHNHMELVHATQSKY